MPQLSLNPQRTAVLSMDMQAGIVAAYITDQAFLSRASSVLEHARKSGMSVIHVQVGFRPNFPEMNARNLLISAIQSSPQRLQLFQGANAAIHPALAPVQHEVVVTKHRVSAFAGTDLEMILRAKDIDTLVLFGISTSGVVLSTLLHAADADYRLVVIKDCCADRDPDVHACLTEKIFPRQATVLSSNDFLNAQP